MAEGGEMNRLTGILRWSLEQQPEERNEDATAEMSQERREFLQAALSEMQSAASDVDVMKHNLATAERVVKSVAETSDNQSREELVDEGVDALEVLCEVCENLDNANDMIPLGGFPVIDRLLQATDSSLLSSSLQLCGVLFQNNPRCQQEGLNAKLLERCLHHLAKSEDTAVRVKAMYATSCLVKDFDPAQHSFLDQGGYKILCGCLKSGAEKLVTKVSFFIANVVSHSLANAEHVISSGVLDQLLSLLASKRTQSLEHVARAVCRLMEMHPGSAAEVRRRRAQLAPQLEETMMALKDHEDDEYQDEIEHIEHLLTAVEHSS